MSARQDGYQMSHRNNMVSVSENSPKIMERIAKVSASDRSFDVEFWQRQGSNAIFAAAWEMVEEAWRWKGRSESELEFQRSVELLKPLRS